MSPSSTSARCAAVNRLAVQSLSTGLSLIQCDNLPSTGFDCGNAEVNQWFAKEVGPCTEQLLVKSFELKIPDDPKQDGPVGLVSLCNDAVLKRDLIEMLPVPEDKLFPSWPAVKVVALGVASEDQRQGVGTEIIRLITQLFTTDNRTGCRFITLEAHTAVTRFYQLLDFEFMTSADIGKKTRTLYLDLLRVRMDAPPDPRHIPRRPQSHRPLRDCPQVSNHRLLAAILSG